MRTISIDITDHNEPGVCTAAYFVQYKIDGDPDYIALPNQYASPIVITNLQDSTDYEISIQRQCCDGNFGTPLIINYNTEELTDNILGLTMTPGTTTMDINWDDYTGADSYNVYMSTTNDINTAPLVYNGAISTYSATGLTTATTYYVWVQARDGDKYSAFATDSETTL